MVDLDGLDVHPPASRRQTSWVAHTALTSLGGRPFFGDHPGTVQDDCNCVMKLGSKDWPYRARQKIKDYLYASIYIYIYIYIYSYYNYM